MTTSELYLPLLDEELDNGHHYLLEARAGVNDGSWAFAKRSIVNKEGNERWAKKVQMTSTVQTLDAIQTFLREHYEMALKRIETITGEGVDQYLQRIRKSAEIGNSDLTSLPHFIARSTTLPTREELMTLLGIEIIEPSPSASPQPHAELELDSRHRVPA